MIPVSHDRFLRAPSGVRNGAVMSVFNRAPEVGPPPNAVVMRVVHARVPMLRARGSIQFRDASTIVDGFKFIVRGLDFIDGFEAMRFADRLAKAEGRPVFVQGFAP